MALKEAQEAKELATKALEREAQLKEQVDLKAGKSIKHSECLDN